MQDTQKPKASTPRKRPQAKSGPKPEVLKLHGNWQAAIKKSLKKHKPPEGWPR